MQWWSSLYTLRAFHAKVFRGSLELQTLRVKAEAPALYWTLVVGVGHGMRGHLGNQLTKEYHTPPKLNMEPEHAPPWVKLNNLKKWWALVEDEELRIELAVLNKWFPGQVKDG